MTMTDKLMRSRLIDKVCTCIASFLVAIFIAGALTLFTCLVLV